VQITSSAVQMNGEKLQINSWLQIKSENRN